MKTKKLVLWLIFIPLLVSTTSSMAQLSKLTPFEDWVSSGGTQAFFQKSVVRTDASGNAHIAGATLNQNGNYDMYIAKYNASGVLLWDVVYAGAGGWHDAASDLRVDGFGNVYVTGSVYTSSNDSNDVITLKYNSSGSLQWDEIYNGASSLNDGGTSLQVDASGNVYVSAFTQDANNGSDFLLLKYDNSGSLLLNQQFDLNNAHDVPVTLIVTSTRLAIAGATQVGTTDWDYLYVAYHPVNGSYISHNTSTGGTAGFDKVHDLQTDASGNFYLTGTVFNASTGYDILTVKLNNNLNVLWSQSYNSTSAMNDVGNALAVDNAGNVIVTGFSETSTEGTNYVTIQYNASGTQQWVKNFNGEGNAADTARALAVDANGNIYVTGSSFNGSTEDFYTLKYKSNGTELWGIGFNNIYNGNDRAFDIAIDSLGNILVCGQSVENASLRYNTVKYIEKAVTNVQDTSIAPAAWSFTANLGQLIDTDTLVAEDVKFYTKQSNPALYFQNDRFNYVWAKIDTSGNGNDTLHRVDMLYYNGNTTKVRAHDKQTFYTNYFLGYIPEHRAKVPHYDNLFYSNVWDNIDIQCGSDPAGFKHFIVVKPNGDPNDIEFRYGGHSSLAVDGNGNLLIITPLDTLVQPEPSAWEIDANGNVTLLNWTASYNINGSNVTLSLGGSYTSTNTLVLGVGWEMPITGPEATGNLDWSTYYGGSNMDIFYDVKTNYTNDIWVTGITYSNDFPLQNAYQGGNVGEIDIIMMKFNSNGVRQWATYIGGNENDGNYSPHRIVVDNAGNSFFACYTASPNPPLINPGNNEFFDPVNDCNPLSSYCVDMFVGRLNNSGQLTWGTFFGGYNGTGRANDIRFDSQNNLYIVGSGEINSVLEDPGGNAYFSSNGHGNIIKFNSSLEIIWSTRFGGNIDTDITTIATDNNDDVIIGGYTASTTNFPLEDAGNGAYYQSSLGGGTYDGFIAKFSDYQLIWSSYFGGNDDDFVHSLTTDSKNNIFIAGNTTSTDFYMLNPGLPAFHDNNYNGTGSSYAVYLGDVFISKFNASGIPQSSTYFGGSGNETCLKLLSDGSNLFAFISTSSDMLPFANPNLTNAFIQSNNADGNDVAKDAFIMVLNEDLEFVWTTYFGGTKQAGYAIDLGYGLTITADSKCYIVGGTESTSDFPLEVLNGAYNQGLYVGTVDGFIARFDITDIPLGMTGFEVKELKSFLYPNPAADFVYIASDTKENMNVEMRISDLTGKIVEESIINLSSNTKIDVSDYKNGFYLVSLKSKTNTVTKKLVINR